jgi:hypothetical protein
MFQSGPPSAASLLLIDPDTGVNRTILQEDGIQAVADGAAWTGVLNHDDPSPPQFLGIGSGIAYNQVSRRDLATGATLPWFYRSGVSVQVAAAVGARLVLWTQTPGPLPPDVWIVSGPDQADRLTIGAPFDRFPLSRNVTADTSGLWLASDGIGWGLQGLVGIYLWTPRTGLILISTVAGTPAGTCIP